MLANVWSTTAFAFDIQDDRLHRHGDADLADRIGEYRGLSCAGEGRQRLVERHWPLRCEHGTLRIAYELEVAINDLLRRPDLERQ
jgi:hypothetical protein